ncbi:MAG: phage virion morphogenesis protein [Cyanobacteria bacterium P01_H01_bin.15]
MKPHEFFRRLQRDLPRLEREIAQTIVAVEAEQFHAENFQKGGFTDKTFVPWRPRKASDGPRGRRALLVKTGAMRRHATTGRRRGSQVDFVFPLPYMKVHNKGGKAGRGRGFQMPKRQYVGKSAELERRIQRKAAQFLNRKLR